MGKFANVLIVTDLDGTLLDHEKNIGAASREAIRYFMSEGGLFTFATGRLYQSFMGICKKLPFNAGGMNAAILFISAVIAASGLNEFASIQITGNRNNNDTIRSTTVSIQLFLFCFFVNILILLISCCDCLDHGQYHYKECEYNSHCRCQSNFPVNSTCFIYIIHNRIR